MQATLPHFRSLGLVCVTASEEIRYRTVTRKRLLTLSLSQRRLVRNSMKFRIDSPKWNSEWDRIR